MIHMSVKIPSCWRKSFLSFSSPSSFNIINMFAILYDAVLGVDFLRFTEEEHGIIPVVLSFSNLHRGNSGVLKFIKK